MGRPIRNKAKTKTKRADGFIEPENGPTDYRDWLRWREVCNGILRVDAEIDSEAAQILLPEIDQIRRDGHKKVTVHIDSCGGSVHDALAIYDNLRALADGGVQVWTVGEGWVASAAAQIILQAGTLRLSWPSTKFLIHEIRRWTFFAEEKASDLKDEAAEYEKVSTQIFELMSKRCGHPVEEIKKLVLRRDVYMTAQEAQEWGLIDQVMPIGK